MGSLANCYYARGKFDKSAALMEESLALIKVKLGPDHPDTLTMMSNLAVVYQSVGRIEDSIALLEQTIELKKKKFDADNPDTLASMAALAAAYQSLGNLDRAIPMYKQILETMKRKLGADHPNVFIIMNNLARAYQDNGEHRKALPLYEETFAIGKAKLGPDHYNVLLYACNLGSCLTATRDYERAISTFKDTLDRSIATLGADHAETWRVRANLGAAYRDEGRLEEAIPLLEAAHTAREKLPTLDWVASELMTAYVLAGQTDKCLTLIHQEIERDRASLPKDSLKLTMWLDEYASRLLELKLWIEAEALLRETLATRTAKEPDAWYIFQTKSMLGAALMGQKKYEESAPLLKEGYEGLRKLEGKIPPRNKRLVAEALDRLIALAEATNKPDDAKKWKEEKAKLSAQAAH